MLEAPQDLRESFDRDGYVVIEDVGVTDSVLTGAVADLHGRFSYEGQWHEDEVGYAPGRIHDAWHLSANVKQIATSAKVLALLEGLYGRRPLPFQTLNFERGTEQAIHSDTIHFNSMPPGFMCGVWVALEDVDMENGPLVYYPGSQKLPERTMKDVGAAADTGEYQKYEQWMRDFVEREGLRAEYGTIPRGHALIWSSNLLHGGAQQRDPERTRHSQVTHYFFEGCRYYTPMLSEGDWVEWRDPHWID